MMESRAGGLGADLMGVHYISSDWPIYMGLGVLFFVFVLVLTHRRYVERVEKVPMRQWTFSNRLPGPRYLLSATFLLATLILFKALSFSAEKNLQYRGVNSGGAVLEVFQVSKPVTTPDPLATCVHDQILMQHIFGWSYGKPFVGSYAPPACEFNRVSINFTVTSAGRQFDRLALMFLGDVEVFRTSTAEPTIDGIRWEYTKDMTAFNTLWRSQQTIIFELGNLLDDTYTGSFNTTLTATFSNVSQAERVADYIIPISSQQSILNRSSAFSVPAQIARSSQTIPLNTTRAVVSIAACGQATEEFWFSNALSSVTDTFTNSTGSLYGYSPFREVQLLVDNKLVGVSWPFPTIFTGGIAPGFWRPEVGIDAFDLAESQIDITPYLSVWRDGKPHDFEIKVVGLDDNGAGHAKLSEKVGSFWIVTGKIFVFVDSGGRVSLSSAEHLVPPDIDISPPLISISSYWSQNATGANETLHYAVNVDRSISILSPISSWTQTLHFSNVNTITFQGLDQDTKQSTSGTYTSSYRDEFSDSARQSSSVSFSYPLTVYSSYAVCEEGFSILAQLSRGLSVHPHLADNPIFPIPIFPGARSILDTLQWGSAAYESVKGNGSFSMGDTTQHFQEGGYKRQVRAAGGRVVEDSDARSEAEGKMTVSDTMAAGRGSVRELLGRGPGI